MNYIYPEEEDFITLPIHLMSNNYLYSFTTRGVVTSRKYYDWQQKFAELELPDRDYWSEVNWNKPLEIFLHYVAMPNRDVHNGDKASIDAIIGRGYHMDDSKVHAVHNKRAGTCNSYDKGEIRFFIRNLKQRK